jgi:hypothetical protein
MRAAKGAMAGARPRSRSSPQTVTEKNLDHPNDAGYALSAATIAHRPSARTNTILASEAGAVPYTTMDRQMFTSNPPVKPETDEMNRADVLHASALAMAKKMYDQQQKIIDTSTRAHARSLTYPGNDTASLASSRTEEQPPLVYNSLQEAAYRAAQERLAKLQEEHDKQRGLQEYYGSGSTPQRTRLGTIKGKLTRRRSSSDGDLLLEDKRRSEQIRKQMSMLGNKLTEVDEEKRTRDRAALLAAAQRNVKAQMQQMDEKVQSDTGRVPQITMDDWGRKALVAAQARFVDIGHNNAGKVDIGGGKLMDRSEVEKIAAQNVQPLLDEINDRAEKEKARQEEEKLDEERRREKAERERMREREVQEIHKKLKGRSAKLTILNSPLTRHRTAKGRRAGEESRDQARGEDSKGGSKGDQVRTQAPCRGEGEETGAAADNNRQDRSGQRRPASTRRRKQASVHRWPCPRLVNQLQQTPPKTQGLGRQAAQPRRQLDLANAQGPRLAPLPLSAATDQEYRHGSGRGTRDQGQRKGVHRRRRPGPPARKQLQHAVRFRGRQGQKQGNRRREPAPRLEHARHGACRPC